MKRQIKFRGKRVDNGEWVYGSAMIWNGIGQIIKHRFMVDGIWDVDKIRVIPTTIGQFTGLTDKNGKEIYEGDVCSAYSIDCGTEILSVIFNQGAFCFSTHNWSINEWKQHNIELIGNIHDNPELI